MTLGRAALTALIAVSCAVDPAPSEPVAAPPVPVVEPAPAVALSLPAGVYAAPTREATTPVPTASNETLGAVRTLLASVVDTHARAPDNPWAIGHALIALGPTVTLTSGEVAVDWLFAEYAGEVDAGGETLVRFPRKRGDIRIEPHTDLLLKALTEVGVAPDRAVTVDGAPHTVEDLYRGSLARAWVDGRKVSFDDWNDAAWALQGLATWAPDDLAWTAEGGHPMTMDGFTSAAVATLSDETAFLREAMARGEVVEKRKQGIFAYTCGGAHLLQATVYAVARGFGTPDDRAAIDAELDAYFYRFPIELDVVDRALSEHPDYAVILLEQRLKFLGHFLETTHKAAALGVLVPDEGEAAIMERAVLELIATVAAINQLRVFERLDAVRSAGEQVYLDYVGDAAHAVAGIDLALGEAAVRY